MGTAERRMEIIKILCRRRHETMSNLAAQFHVSVKTIQRDIDSISLMIPIYTQSGRYTGGVYVVEGYSMDRMYMSTKEIELLTMIVDRAKRGDSIQLNENQIQQLITTIQSFSKPVGMSVS